MKICLDKSVQYRKHADLVITEGLYERLWNAQISGFLPEKAN